MEMNPIIKVGQTTTAAAFHRADEWDVSMSVERPRGGNWRQEEELVL
jgi:hypothetical protein